MAKPNYAFAKRQKELAKKQKKEEKKQLKSDAKQSSDSPDGELEGELADGEAEDGAEVAEGGVLADGATPV
jgi:hypothetical protein